MIKIIHYIGLDVHKNSIAVAIAVEEGGELRSYGNRNPNGSLGVGHVSVLRLEIVFCCLRGEHDASRERREIDYELRPLAHGVIKQANDKTQPRRADDANRDSGTESATRRWLQ